MFFEKHQAQVNHEAIKFKQLLENRALSLDHQTVVVMRGINSCLLPINPPMILDSNNMNVRQSILTQGSRSLPPPPKKRKNPRSFPILLIALLARLLLARRRGGGSRASDLLLLLLGASGRVARRAAHEIVAGVAIGLALLVV